MNPEGKIKIALADDHRSFCEGLAAQLDSRKRFSVVGIATATEQIEALVQDKNPAVLILDLYLPEAEQGLAMIQWAAKQSYLKLAVLTGHVSEADFTMAVKMGCPPAHFFPKTWSVDRIAGKIVAIYKGQDPVLEQPFQSYLTNMAKNGRCDNPYGLSERELDALQHVAHGKTDRQTGAEMRYDPRTVRRYLASAKKKLGAQNRIEAVIIARDANLIL